MLKDLLDLARSQGPVQAAWVLLFVFIAWLAGKGSKMAMANIRELLEQSDLMRNALNDQLGQANTRINALEQQLNTASQQMAQLLDEMRQLREENDRLRRQIHGDSTYAPLHP